jgi:hypothetical protein
MQTAVQYPSPRTYYHRPTKSITTTLYDLMEAVQEEVSPDEEGLVTRVVADLFNSGRIRLAGNAEGLDVDMARSRR